MKNLNDSFFDDINGYSLDICQRKIILNNENNILVVAGAGSGKTLTIIGKIKYLIEKLHYHPKDILCISFTNETVDNLIRKVGYKIDCFTFHKLGLVLLNDYHYSYKIADSLYLDYIVKEYFYYYIYQDNYSDYVYLYLHKNFKKYLSLSNLISEYPDLFNIYLKQLTSFIRKIKTNDFNYDDLLKIVNKVHRNDKAFILIALRIYCIYQEELLSSNEIDFDDMLSISTRLVKSNSQVRNYKYIIIDEYQDTSLVRYNLIKELLLKTKAKLMCVGDDYQSIYGFSGCTLDLFVNFKKYFDNSKIMYINNTYRNSYEIIKISTKFIRKNHYQLKKRLHANFFLKNPIKLIYYNDVNYKTKFYRLLDYLDGINQKNLLILGRYNNDINKVMDKVMYKDLNLKYLTVHCSKGLEEDNIILLNMEDGLLGFPSKIKDDKVFNLVNNNRERFPYAEERRLFYVALTRTKNNVYIMVHENKTSIFIKEIRSKCIELKL